MYSLIEKLAKRAFDVGASATGLLAISPVLVGVGVLVKMTSKGPVLFKQQRVGRGEQLFTMFKFRTMRTDNQGLGITASGDDRITPVGRILRKTKLDELPEIYNVLIGDMSLVGPRPEVPQYVEHHYRTEWKRVFAVRPGITDPATVRFRNEEELLAGAPDPHAYYVEEILPEKLGINLDYLDRASFLSDIAILFETFAAIARG